jgi:hypothetical protein
MRHPEQHLAEGVANWRLQWHEARANAAETMKPNRNGLVMDKLAVIAICLAMLVAGCGGSLRGDASVGPNPGGGFYSPSNIDNGRVNP